MTNEEIKFTFTINGIHNDDEQLSVMCNLLDTIMKLGYNCNSENFEINFM